MASARRAPNALAEQAERRQERLQTRGLVAPPPVNWHTSTLGQRMGGWVAERALSILWILGFLLSLLICVTLASAVG